MAEFGRGIPEEWLNWHPEPPLETLPELTDEEIEAAIQILEVIHTQIPTRKDSPRAFYQQRITPAKEDIDVEQPPFDIFLSQHVETEIASHLDSVAPLEAIGLMLGRIGIDEVDEQERTYVELKETIPLRPIHNTSRVTATTAAITCTGWQRAWEILDYLRKAYPDVYGDVHIIGWYHQHPLDTALSQMDIFVHNAAFTEPHQVTFVRGSHRGATGVFYRPVEIGEERILRPVGHLRQTAGYWYENNKPVAYDILEYIKSRQKEARLPEMEAISETVRAQLTPWFTDSQIERELKEILKVAAIIAFEEILEDEEIVISPEDVDRQMQESVIELEPLAESVRQAFILLKEAGFDETGETPDERISLEEINPSLWEEILKGLRDVIGSALIRLGERIKRE